MLGSNPKRLKLANADLEVLFLEMQKLGQKVACIKRGLEELLDEFLPLDSESEKEAGVGPEAVKSAKARGKQPQKPKKK